MWNKQAGDNRNILLLFIIVIVKNNISISKEWYSPMSLAFNIYKKQRNIILLLVKVYFP